MCHPERSEGSARRLSCLPSLFVRARFQPCRKSSVKSQYITAVGPLFLERLPAPSLTPRFIESMDVSSRAQSRDQLVAFSAFRRSS